MDKETYQQVQALSRMTVGELQEKISSMSSVRKRGRSTRTSFASGYAWRIQALAEGGLSEQAKTEGRGNSK